MLTPLDTLQHFIDTIVSVYKKVKNEVDGLAFSMTGNIDSETGQIFDIPFSIPHVQVDVCAHFNDSNLIGAFYHYTLQKELEKGEL